MKTNGKKVPVRMCIACRERFEQAELFRVGIASEGFTFLSPGDSGRKLHAGRSVYLCESEKCMANARKKNLFAKALKQAVPSEVYQELEMAMDTWKKERN